MAVPKKIEKAAKAEKLAPKAKLTPVPTPKPEVKEAKPKAEGEKKEFGARSALYDKKIVHVADISEARRIPAEDAEPTATYLRYKLYKVGQTVKDFLEKGGKMVDVNWDVKHGFIKLA